MGWTRSRFVAGAGVTVLLFSGALTACGGDSSSTPSAEPSSDATTASGSASESTTTEPSESESESESSAPVTPAVLAHTYVSTSVTGHDLVADTTIRLTFDDGNLSVSAGCNTMFAPYALNDGSLKWSAQPAATMIGCSEELAAQDQWLTELFTQGVDVAADSGHLTLTSADVVIELSRTPDADLQGLLGKTWRGVATMADGTTQRIPARTRRPTLVVGKNGLSRLDTGCNTGRTTVSVDETSINFGHPAVTRVACQEPDRTIEQRVLAVVDGRSDYVIFDGSVLIVVKGDNGLVFQVR